MNFAGVEVIKAQTECLSSLITKSVSQQPTVSRGCTHKYVVNKVDDERFVGPE